MTINLDKILGVTVSTILTITLWGSVSRSNPNLLPNDIRLVTFIVGLTNGVMYVSVSGLLSTLDKD